MDPAKNPDRPLLGIPVVVRRVGLCAVTAAISLAIVSACGSSSSRSAGSPAATASSASIPSGSASAPDTSATSATMPAAASMIMIQNYKYTSPVTVGPGATVSVMNMDGENHTVTADSGDAFDVKAIAGTTVTFTAPTKPGSYPYHCTYHAEMHGVLIVR